MSRRRGPGRRQLRSARGAGIELSVLVVVSVLLLLVEGDGLL
ncbi:hypothetical protein [Aquabacterium humicola]|nr:hypothetical protein [Rubrivivax pictus]